MVLNLGRYSLLNSGFDWRKLREERKNLPAQFETNPYLLKMEKCIEMIYSTILRGTLPLLIQSADDIQSRALGEKKKKRGSGNQNEIVEVNFSSSWV
jgi:hypothetical protein